MSLADKDIRDAFFDELCRIGSRDPNVVIITNDMDVFSLRKFKQDYPRQFINIGVAEQNMINVAAGLAACGKRVFVFGILSFVTFRCYEQIKVNICSMRLPVTIIGMGAGLSFGFDGPTHHAMQDIGLMRLLPEMEILNPGDSASAAQCARLAYEGKGPMYIRIDKGTFPEFYNSGDNFSSGLKVLRDVANSDVTIVASGFMTRQAVAVADALESQNVRAGVIDIFRLKPVDGSALRDLADRSRSFVVLDENAASGGLGTIISEILARHSKKIPFISLTLPDKQFLEYGAREWFLNRSGLDAPAIVEAVLALVGRKVP
ncbi:MAG: hypothetical protein A2270_11020 [Elusimicrobia bacterium RIFOXYA12_FULL_51_18]|nr:MAG: hypothetical protein A2270_11020 [Elusimicrobia bacterium RIFOXYA12_FULL_51_18]OGS32311.1 MAG: hypothetical protein A2218_02860 [Elusimicrobia bacterium RIFOXYA2_FULL_53_38]